MKTLGRILTRLSTVTNGLAGEFGTDEFFILRAGAGAADGRGNKTKTYTPTTATPYGCFMAVLPISADKEAELRAAQRRPVIFRRFVVQTTTGVLDTDRLRLVARGDTPQIDMEIVKVAPLSGLVVEVLTVEEVAS